MARPTVGKQAMTPAERQQRRRKRLKAERAAETKKVERAKRRAKNTDLYIPMPPGVTYWQQVTVITPDGEHTVWAPKTRPLAACDSDLEDRDVLALLSQLRSIAEARGLDIRTEVDWPQFAGHANADEAVTIGGPLGQFTRK